MANRFWVGGASVWNATAGTKWATTSGGAGGAAVPTAADDVFFDANSGAVAVTTGVAMVCRSLNFTGFTGSFTRSNTLTIGDATAGASNIALKLVAGMTWAGSQNVSFVSTSTTVQTVDFAGFTVGVATLTFNGAGGKWQMQGNYSNTTSNVTITAGQLDLNGFTYQWQNITFSGSTTRALLMTNAAITCTGNLNLGGTNQTVTGSSSVSLTLAGAGAGSQLTSSGNSWGTVIKQGAGTWTLQDAFTVTGTFSFTAGTFDTNAKTCSSGAFGMTGATARTLIMTTNTWTVTGTVTFSGSNMTFTISSTATMVVNANAGNTWAMGGISWGGTMTFNLLDHFSCVITGGFTAVTVNINGTTGACNDLAITAGTTITASGTMTFAGFSSSKRPLVRSNTRATAASLSAATYSITDCNFMDITFGGAGATASGTRVGVVARCSGVTATTPQSNFWVGGTGNWSDVNKWASTSGGGGGTGRVPLPQDKIVMDASSGSGTATMDCIVMGAGWDLAGSVAILLGTVVAGSTLPISPVGRASSTYDRILRAGWVGFDYTTNPTTGLFAQFDAGGTVNITTNGVKMPIITFQGSGTATQLDDADYHAGMSTQFGADYAMNGHNMSLGNTVAGAGSILVGFTSTATFHQGSGDIHFKTTGTTLAINGTSTFDGGTGTIYVDDATSTAKNFSVLNAGVSIVNKIVVPAGCTVTFNHNTAAAFATITTLQLAPGSTASFAYTAATVYVITNLIAVGTIASPIIINSLNSPSQAIVRPTNATMRRCLITEIDNSVGTVQKDWDGTLSSTQGFVAPKSWTPKAVLV